MSVVTAVARRSAHDQEADRGPRRGKGGGQRARAREEEALAMAGWHADHRGALEPCDYCGQYKTRRPWIGRRVRLLSSASPLIVLRNRYYFFIFSSSMHFFCASPVKFLHFSGTCPKAAAELSAKTASTRETRNFFIGTSS
jgi:hypothetical protein